MVSTVRDSENRMMLVPLPHQYEPQYLAQPLPIEGNSVPQLHNSMEPKALQLTIMKCPGLVPTGCKWSDSCAYTPKQHSFIPNWLCFSRTGCALPPNMASSSHNTFFSPVGKPCTLQRHALFGLACVCLFTITPSKIEFLKDGMLDHDTPL